MTTYFSYLPIELLLIIGESIQNDSNNYFLVVNVGYPGMKAFIDVLNDIYDAEYLYKNRRFFELIWLI